MNKELLEYLKYNGFYIWKDYNVAMKKITICEHCGRYVTLEILPDGDYKLWDERGYSGQTSVPKEYVLDKVETISDAKRLISFIKGVVE
jgi:hypothetical protein